jgi:hypothetical protein
MHLCSYSYLATSSKTSKFGLTATTRVWIEAENHFNARIQAEALYGRSNIISNPLLVKR